MKHRLKLLYVILSALLLGTGCHSGDPEGACTPGSPEALKAILGEKAGQNPFDNHLEEAPDEGCVRMRINSVGPLRKAFNDSNYIHIEAARALGIEPIETDADILRLRRPVVKVASCRDFFVDELSHSYPYLVPEAAALLTEIGHAFRDSLRARGGGDYRIKVTSVLRTPTTVKRLRRVNRNAVEESTHSYGTTFDISYSKFICDSDTGTRRTFEDLKNLLAEVLYRLRDEGRCYVKYEYRQSCFHITTRPTDKV